MTQVLPSPPLPAAVLGASLLLAVTPGPGMLYVVVRSLAQGQRAGLASVAGLAAGSLGQRFGQGPGLHWAARYLGAASFLGLGVLAALGGQRQRA